MGAAGFASDTCAKIHLVRTAQPDYYELLRVPRDADGETIRRAFHAAARELHPDVSDDPEADRRFRQLAEAYAVLSKPGSRLLYDRYGYRGRGYSDLGASDEAAGWERGDAVRLELAIEQYEAESGARKLIEFESATVCSACDGGGTARAPDPDCALCGGTGWHRNVSHRDVGRLLQIEVCPACDPGICSVCGGSGRAVEQRRLRLRIPAGVEEGSQLRVRGEGELPSGDGVPGDLLVDVRVHDPPRDLRFVRYAAAILFVAAVVSLLVYLYG